MELEVAVLLILATLREEAVEVSIVRFSLWLGLLTHTITDLIILSDDESAGAESETNYSDLDVDVRAKSDSDPQHITDSELADGDGFGSGATLIPDRPITDHQDDSNHNNGVVDHTKPQLTADHLKSASPSQSFPTHQASKLQVNTDNTQGTMSSVNVNFDVTNS